MASDKVFIHVGLHKTGTTFFQTRVFPFLDANIISNENYSGRLYSGNTKEYRDILAYGLKSMYPDASIIVGVRDPEDWLFSVYCHNVKYHGYYHTYDFFRRHYDLRILNFKSYIKLLKSLFKDVYIYDFNRFVGCPQSVVDDICGFVGVNSFVLKDVGCVNKGLGSKYGFIRNINQVRDKVLYVYEKVIN